MTSPYLSNYLVNNMLQQFFSAQTHYLSLHTADPQIYGEITEVQGAGYGRQLVGWSPAGNRLVANTSVSIFRNLPACIVTHFGVYDTNSGVGNLLVSFPVNLATGVLNYNLPTGGALQVSPNDLAIVIG